MAKCNNNNNNNNNNSNEKIDYSYFISPHASRRRSALTRELTKRAFDAPKGTISLAEGMPNDAVFPIEEISVRLKDGTQIHLNGAKLAAGLQYAPTPGYPPLVQALKAFTQRIHNPPNWEQRDVLITNGSQDGISKALEMSVADGDAVLVQDPLYTGAEIVLKPFRTTLLEIEQDAGGMRSDQLAVVLAQCWERCNSSDDALSATARMPKVLYINPTGSNPTGTTVPLERRREIYRLCCQYNVLILEDDAYCFMNFQEDQPQPPPSFLSLDTEGRVIRFDSFSKVLSSGLRVGWITGPQPLIRAIELHIQSSHLHSSTLSQVITESLLEMWGHDKLMSHLNFVRDYYRARRDYTVAAMQRHLGGLAEWTVPAGGMFVWLKVCGITDVYKMLLKRGIAKGITFVPGHAFMADPTKACSYIRAAYSRATPKQIDKAMRLLAELIREERVTLKRKIDQSSHTNKR